MPTENEPTVAPAAVPATAPAPAPVPAATPTPAATEMSPESISEFVSLAEEGGWSDRNPYGGLEDFPDLPPQPEPATPGVAQPAPVTPAVVAPSVPAAPVQPVVPPVPAVPQTPQAPVVPGAQPTPAVQTPPEATAPVAAAPVVAPAAPTVPAQPVRNVDPFAMVAEQIKLQEQPFIEALAKQEYNITPEEHEAFVGGDTSKLSLLCARIQANAVRSAMQTVSTYLPVFVNGLMRAARDDDAREARFWEGNPFLDRGKHRDIVEKTLRTYNQLNPGADEATRFKAVGLLVAQLNGIPITSPQAGGVPNAPSVAPAVRTPGPVVRTVPQPAFAPPASGGGSPAVAPAANGESPWGDFVNFAMAADSGQFDQE